MKTELSIFQVILLAVFGIFAIAGVIYFARGTYNSESESVGQVLIWGTIDEQAISAVLRELADADPRLLQVEYVQRDARTFDVDLADAIASGKGPDLIVLEHEYLMKNKDKLVPFPAAAVSQRQFKDTFIDGADIFLTNEVIDNVEMSTIGIPIAVDPMVMYANRDLLRTGGLASSSPDSWNQVFDIAEKTTRRDDSGNIVKSGIAFGTYDNVTHAKEILATLIMQAGNPITLRGTDGVVRAVIAQSSEQGGRPAENALRFFTEFANPAKIVYSWNMALPASRVAFGEGDVGLYAGFGSEYTLLTQQNPNLDFDVAMMPQIKDQQSQSTVRAVTFGRMYAFSIPRGSYNPSGAMTVAFILAGTDSSRLLWQASGFASPRRDVLSGQVSGAVQSVIRDSAIIAHAWLDPDPVRTEIAFKGMIDDTISGASRLGEAVQRAEREISNLLEE